MSTQTNTYVMLGALFPYETFEGGDAYDKLDPYLDSAFRGIYNHNGLCVLFDGMSGAYVAIGRVIAKSRNGEGFDQPISLEFSADDVSAVERDIAEHIGSIRSLPSFTVKPIVLTHYR